MYHKHGLKGESTKKLVEVCNQYLDAGLIELSANKIDEIYSEAAKDALEIKKGKPERRSPHPYKHKAKRKKWYD